MKKWKKLADMGIQNKLILMCCSIALFLSIIFGSFVFKTSHSYVLEKINESNMSIARQVAVNIEHMKQDLFQTSTLICVNPAIQEYMRSPQDDMEVPGDLIDYIAAAKSEISLIILYNKDGYPVYYRSSDMSSGIHPLQEEKEWELYEQAQQQDGGALWFRLNQEQNLFLDGSKQDKIILCRSIKDLYTMEVQGLMVIGVNEPEIRKQFISTYDEEERILVCDDTGQVLLTSGNMYSDFIPESTDTGDDVSEGYFTYRRNRRRFFTAFYRESKGNWTYYYLIPSEKLSYPIRSSLMSACLLVLISMLIIYPLSRIVVAGLTRPIFSLLDSMKRFRQGCFDEHIKVTGNDEIGKLQAGYNEMVHKIKNLINDVYILQIKEQEAEIKALQAEINPHFLYNTLDMAYWRAEAQGVSDLAEIIYSISRIFRLTLNVGKAITTVRAEKEFIEHYLNLQKMRFYDKFSYEILIPDSLLEYEIPKLLLQPFVENAVIHGIEPLENEGKITISGIDNDSFLSFTIKDNGVGMTQEAILGLKNYQKDMSDRRESYAIRNIYERLNLYYGEACNLDIQSNPNEGTAVILHIPKQIKKEENPYETARGR